MRKALSNPNPSQEAVRVYEYLCEMEGKGILAGQQECPAPGYTGSEMRYIAAVTGKLPAIRGLDYIHQDFDRVNRRAKAWWHSGGIVTICYHWGTPPDGFGYKSSLDTVDLTQLLTEGTELHAGLLQQMDAAAVALQKLRNAGVPVLWRPFHEFDGGWFWWGKGTPEQFARLWRLMYRRYTEEFGLNNLIWVLGYDGGVKDGWYPGDAYVDIVGADTYQPDVPVPMYHRLTERFGDRLLRCYHENGLIPDPQELILKKLHWSWFMTWHTTHIRRQNTQQYLRYVYNHDYVITRDKLPRFIP